LGITCFKIIPLPLQNQLEMHRTHTCGDLRLANEKEEVVLSGWVQGTRDLGAMTFLDLRDRYGITQIVFTEDSGSELMDLAGKLGREFVLKVKGTVRERSSKNPKIPTGDIEVLAKEVSVLNESKTPPFTIEDQTDGGDELRMKYRYLDLRRNTVQKKLILRHRLALATRAYLDGEKFLEIETPYLIKSTPEGARDFVVPSRMNPGEFYALPQSPQTFKQLLMVSGFDRYFQIVRCFRDEDLRADRQPEFTQIDCEMAFVEQEDILNTFEGLTKHLFKEILNVELPDFPRMDYEVAMSKYGSDKPDVRFGMEINDLSNLAKGKGFQVFDNSESVLAIVIPGAAEYSRKQLDALTDWVRRPQIGAKGLVYVKFQGEHIIKSSVDKFFSTEDLEEWCSQCGAQQGDLLLVLSGKKDETRKQIGELRLYMGDELGLRTSGTFAPLWVIDFPLMEWSEEDQRFFAMHHPFTSPKPEDIHLLDSDTGKVRANAYDLVINGVEIGGGSIRIHNKALQAKIFELLAFTEEEAQEQFGFLMNAFEYGAPPHGGIAFGFDRLTSLMGGSDTIRDYIAFPKNNSGRDVMIDAPAHVDTAQLDELSLQLKLKS
jgi:aspartyl-tRNA synthetase